MRCFYNPDINSKIIRLSREEEKHLFSVLKAKYNEKILITDGKGQIATAAINPDKTLSVLSIEKIPPPATKVHLFVASPRKNKMDQLLSQCTELGVWSIQPIITERSVAVPDNVNNISKWKTKLIEACKQAHNPFIPDVTLPIPLNNAITRARHFKCFFGATSDSPSEEHRNFTGSDVSDIAWFVGPEGGFSDNEISAMLENSFIPLKIGRWIMRVETATVAGVALVQELYPGY